MHWVIQAVKVCMYKLRLVSSFSLGALLCLVSITSASAGQVVVRKSSEPFDAFAVRDEVQRKHQWQEALRYQQQLQILQSLPIGCLAVVAPYQHFACQGLYYRPYQYQNQQLYIQIDPPSKTDTP
ncbi:hypothetical protein [Shewanella pneumatophori]